MLQKTLILAAFSVLLSTSNAQIPTDSVFQRIINVGTSDNRTMDHLDILCNRFGGRLVGSDAFENASVWAASKFDEWGLKVVIDDVGYLPVGFPFIIPISTNPYVNSNFWKSQRDC